MPPLPIPDQLRRQADWCKRIGSPLYSHLLSRCADNYESGGNLHVLLLAHEKDSETSVLSLRLMGAIHRLVLEGKAPELSKFYPSAGGTVEFEGAWTAFDQTVAQHMDALRELIGSPVQTNDVGRSGSLLGGFGVIAEQTSLPLRLLEIGTSGGLNLRWDQYRYEWPDGGWGNVASAVRFENVFVGKAPSIRARVDISERAGCDPLPVDIGSNSGRVTLLSYTWADQMDRIQRLDAAIKIAREVPCATEKARGGDWLEERLNSSFAGVATVIFHSVVWQYISEPEQERITKTIESAGSRATEKAPVAWLRLEPNNDRFEIRLRIYPGFEERVLGTSRPHAPSVQWLL